MKGPITFDFIGGPWDGQRYTRPDSLPIRVTGYMKGNSYLLGEYHAGERGQRGKMLWRPKLERLIDDDT